MQTVLVEDGQIIDYSLVDTSVLYRQIDKYTQIRFHAWDINPKTATQDYTIQALSETGVIELVSPPAQKNYFNQNGDVNLDGLKVNITLVTQTSEYDNNGNRKTTRSVTDIAKSCYATPSVLSEAFKDGSTADILIYPPESDLYIYEYKIYYLKGLGDIDSDGSINAIDASLILTHYALISTGSHSSFTDEQLNNADIDRNGSVNAIDASMVLTYYAQAATGQNPSWETMLGS
ncbi:MAG: hypothetical protein IJX77_00205 [Ruminococcus sp.]|nr:hypothetical protein [Ruminococcus sp.]